MLNLITVLIALPLVLGFLGGLHPALDGFSHFRLYALGAWIIWMIVRSLLARGSARYGWWLLMVISGGYLYAIMRPFSPPPLTPSSSHKTLTHLQYNINLNNRAGIETIKRYIVSHKIDVVTLQEVTHSQEKSFRQLAKQGYRWQAYCMRRTTQEAILSRHPFVAGSVRCEEHQGFVAAQIDLGETTLSVASIHLFLPFPYGQSAQAMGLREAFASLRAPILLAGDFNAAPWSQTVKYVEQFSRTHVVPGLRMTIPTDYHRIPYVPLPIDQVLISSDLRVESIATAPHMGSDHWPVFSRIAY